MLRVVACLAALAAVMGTQITSPASRTCCHLQRVTQLRGGGGTEMVRELEDADELEALHQEANEAAQLLVLDFTATWCGPCQRIAPVVHDLAEEYSGQAIFAKIDVDIMGDVAAELGVTSMPTFLFFRNGELVDTMRGADETGLRERVAEHTN